MLEMRLLQYFWTVADAGTVSAAAQRLHVTQPTISRQLKELEQQLGAPLFERRHQRLILTEAGLFLKSRAEEILALTQQTQQAFVDRQQTVMRGTIHIGCVEADNSDTMAMLLEELTQDYPEVTFSIYTGDGALIGERLDKGLLDVAIMIEPIDTAKYFTLQLPRVEKWGLLTATSSFLAQQPVIRPADLSGIPLMLSPRPEVQAMLQQWQGENPSPQIVGHYNLTFNSLALIERQVASALAIEGVTHNLDPDVLRFVPLAPAVTTHCVLVWRKNRVLTPLVSDYIQRFKIAFEQ